MSFADKFYSGRVTYRDYLDDRLKGVLRMVSRDVETAPVRRVLDIGCGGGVLLDALKKATGGDTYGIDLNRDAVEYSTARGHSTIVHDIGQGLPYDAGAFDLVVIGEVIEHLVDPDATLREVRRCLAPGGLLIVTTPNLAAWFNRLLLLCGIQPVFTECSSTSQIGRVSRIFGQGFPVQGHLRIFTLPALRDLLALHGFHTVEVRGAPFPAQMPFSFIDRLIARCPSFAAGLIVSARLR